MQTQSRSRLRGRLFDRSAQRRMAEDKIVHYGHSRRFPDLEIEHTCRYLDIFLRSLSGNSAF